MNNQKFDNLEELHKFYIDSGKWKLYEEALNPVHGDGNPNADIMFIGEAPGATEDKTGKPFVGAAGKFLALLLESIGLKREDVYITNTVKARPPDNRDPLDSEKDEHAHWLKEEIRIINPKVFVPLGRHALHKFLPGVSISSVHGQVLHSEEYDRAVFAMYHPAAALYNGSLREVLMADVQNLKNFLDGKVEAKKVGGAVNSANSKKESESVRKVKEILARKKVEDAEKVQKEDSGQTSLF